MFGNTPGSYLNRSIVNGDQKLQTQLNVHDDLINKNRIQITNLTNNIGQLEKTIHTYENTFADQIRGLNRIISTLVVQINSVVKVSPSDNPARISDNTDNKKKKKT